jgi:hypothetical protein
MSEKFGSLESIDELTLGELVKLKPNISHTHKSMLSGIIEAGQTYKLHYISVDEDGIMVGYVGPVDLKFDVSKFGLPDNLADERKLIPVALKHLARVTN